MMRLGLSSTAAPSWSADALFAACRARGLAALELVEGDAHGLDRNARPAELSRLVALARAYGVELCAFRATRPEDDGLAALSTGTGLLVILHGEDAIGTASELRIQGARVAVAVRGRDPDAVRRVVALGFDIAWDADASQGEVGAPAREILEAAGERLVHVRLLGGGPEAVMHEGKGIGELMGRMTLARYGGPVVLAPSSTRYRVVWQSWLDRRSGWGCGSKESADDLVTLVAGRGGGK